MTTRTFLGGYDQNKVPCCCRECGKVVLGQREWLGFRFSKTYRCVRHKCTGDAYPKHRTVGSPQATEAH